MSLKNKKITVMGLGLHGGGAAVVKWLVNHGARVTVTDLKSKIQLATSISKLKNLKIKWVLGKHSQADFEKVDLIVQNPGVPTNSKYLSIASKNKVLIENDASLFFKHCPSPIIGVTGTRGKSTTSTLINHLLSNSYLGGLSQQPMMSILEKVKKNNFAVLELSSWQLEILGAQKLSPAIAVVTNIYPDHLNRYNSMAAYIRAKKNIYINQNQDQTIILNKDNAYTRQMGAEVKSKRFWFSVKFFAEENGTYVKENNIFFRQDGVETKLINLNQIKILGQENLENILAALAVTCSIKINISKIQQVLKTFSGLPGRSERLGVFQGIAYINDTTSTIPEATIAALNKLENKKVILIAGGDYKNIPNSSYKNLAQVVRKKCHSVVLFDGRGSEQLKKYLTGGQMVAGVKNMSEAVSIAKSFANRGDVILLSPACASFNLFINEFDRGDQFVAAIKNLNKI